jgi:hypothetical protein
MRWIDKMYRHDSHTATQYQCRRVSLLKSID